jgi:ATP-dependent Clp protease adaptor protein ClpS
VAEPPPAAAPAPVKPGAAASAKSTPRPTGPQNLPPYKVLLHNDDISPMEHVVRSLRQLTPVNGVQAHQIMMTAHTRGVALVLVTHKERAELYVEQFRTKKLLVTIEPT